VVLALALLAAACGDDVSEASSGDATIAITEPGDGATVGTEFTVTVDPSVEIGEPDTGRNHVHLYYDGVRSDDPADYDIVYTTSFTVTRLDPGEHTIEAVIANADHSVTDVATEIAVTVSDDAPAGGSGDAGDEPTTSTSDGFDY
jgi:hypothetical protein